MEGLENLQGGKEGSVFDVRGGVGWGRKVSISHCILGFNTN
jgi:hypothetical protein